MPLIANALTGGYEETSTCQKEKFGLWKHSEVKEQINKRETEWESQSERYQVDQVQTDSYGCFHFSF